MPLRNEKCWAHHLGGCSTKMSKEHIFSECLLEDMVTLHGFARIPEKMISKTAASSKILCRKHNSLLSNLDQEAKQMQSSLKDIHELLRSASPLEKIEGYPKVVNGLLFERWCLKTVINCLVVNNPSYRPSWDLVEFAFGANSFRSDYGQGLYLIDPIHHGNQWINQHRIFFAPKQVPANRLIGESNNHKQVNDEPLLLGTFVNIFGFHFWLRTLAGINIGMKLDEVQIDTPKYYRQKSFMMTCTKLSTGHPERGILPFLTFMY